jgi:tetratricopeptide (TPR) repeat protein
MGDGPGRLKAITEAVQRGPGNADCHWLKSNFHRADGDIDPAIEHARSAVAIDADSVPATHALVLSLLESGQDSLAESAVRAWLKQHPGDLYGHHLLGTTLRNQGRQLAAAPHLAAGSGSGPDWIHGDQRLIEAMGRGLQARRLAAIRKMEQGEAAAAAEELTLLSEANPEDASLLINLAMAQLAMDQRAAARNSLKRALQLDAELDLAHRQLAAVELRGHSADTLRAQPDLLLEAERNLRRARGIAPNSSANQALLGRVLVLQGRPEEAADLLLLAGLANPGDTGLTLKTVGLLLELKRYDDMIELLKILRVLRPGDPQVVLLMAKAQYGRGELETAVAQLKQAARRWPRHGAIRSTLAQWNATP